MPVSEVRGNTAVEPDHVYVTPGRNDVALEGDVPRSAIASGCVDLVLTPTRIAQELSRLSRHPYVITPPGHERADEPSPSSPKEKDGLRAILALLRRTTGSDFSTYKPQRSAADRAAHGPRRRRDAGGVRGLPRGPRGRGAGPPRLPQA